jgi:prolyl-tRNA synthetase
MRSREFIMKDAYSFDRDRAGLDESYLTMRAAYTRIFRRCGLDFRPVAADSGPIGGKDSEEFIAFGEYGESDVLYCSACDYAATSEQAAVVDAPASEEPELPIEAVSTPGTKTIEAVADYLGLPKEQTLKALLFQVHEETGDGTFPVREYVAVFVRGDRELNLTKLRNALGGVAEHLIEFADEAAMGAVTGSVGGFTGPVGLHDCRIVADSEVPGLRNLCAGALREDTHYIHVNYGRDWTADLVADLKLSKAGDACPECGAPLKTARGIEVGQIFKLGTKYSEALGAVYTDETQQEQRIVMGCYGIGVTRTMAAIVEQHHDENGIIWPLAVAPFHVILCAVKYAADEEVRRVSDELYGKLQAAGAEVLFDDRDERPGVKFKDADVIGIPLRITVGKRAGEGIVEYKRRSEAEREEVTADEAVDRVIAAVAGR